MEFYKSKQAGWFTTPEGKKLIKLPGATKWTERVACGALIYGERDQKEIAARESVQKGIKIHEELESGELNLDDQLDFTIIAKEVLAWLPLTDGRTLVGVIDVVGQRNGTGTMIVADYKNVSWVRPPADKSMLNWRKQVSLYTAMLTHTYGLRCLEAQVIQIMDRRVADVQSLTKRGINMNLKLFPVAT